MTKNKLTRQIERTAIRRGLEKRLRAMDFQGERVAIRDNQGKAIIHRPEPRRFKHMMKAAFVSQWRKRVVERKNERGAVNA